MSGLREGPLDKAKHARKAHWVRKLVSLIDGGLVATRSRVPGIRVKIRGRRGWWWAAERCFFSSVKYQTRAWVPRC